jgi:hypothetical protein
MLVVQVGLVTEKKTLLGILYIRLRNMLFSHLVALYLKCAQSWLNSFPQLAATYQLRAWPW